MFRRRYIGIGINIDDRQTGLVSLEDIQSVEREIIKSVQKGYFKDETEVWLDCNG